MNDLGLTGTKIGKAEMVTEQLAGLRLGIGHAPKMLRPVLQVRTVTTPLVALKRDKKTAPRKSRGGLSGLPHAVKHYQTECPGSPE